MAPRSPKSPPAAAPPPAPVSLPRGEPLAAWFVAILLFVLPLKLGSSIAANSTPLCPLEPWQWLFMLWPPFLAAVLGGAALLLALLGTRPETLLHLRRQWLWWLAPALLAAVNLLGFIHSTELETARLFARHLLGVLCLGLAAALLLCQRPERRQLFFWSLVLSMIALGLSGWTQRLSGLEETRRFVEYQAETLGREVDPQLLHRLGQNRVFGPFIYPNSFCAHMILLTPLALLAVWRAAAAVEPARISQPLLTGLAAILLLGTIALTGSRAGLAALALAIGLSLGLWQLCRRRWLRPEHLRRGGLALIVLLGIWGAAIYLWGGRDNFSSLGARFSYQRAAAQMFVREPLTGVGQGEYFPWYMRLKTPDSEETRIPHSLFFTFLSQCGILGGAAAVLFLAMPFLLWWRVIARGGEAPGGDLTGWAVLSTGWIAWSLHALVDFNDFIPATMMTVACLPALVLAAPPEPEPEPAAGRAQTAWPWRLVLLGLGLLALTGLGRFPGEWWYSRQEQVRLQESSSLAELAAVTQRAGEGLPSSPYPWEYLGKDALRARDFVLAEQAFRRAVHRAPHRAAYHAYLAHSLIGQGRLDEARAEARLALAWYPGKADYRRLGEWLQVELPPVPGE